MASSICATADESAPDFPLAQRALVGALLPYGQSHQPATIALSRPFVRDARGRVGCRVMETLPSGKRCAEALGRTLLDTEDGLETCEVAQLAVPPEQRVPGATIAGAGWYYDDFTPGLSYRPQVIATTSAFAFVPSSLVRVECLAIGAPSGSDGGIDPRCVEGGE